MLETVVNQSPLLDFFVELGCETAGLNGKTVINSFASPVEEHNSLYSGVGLRDISSYGIIELKGADVLDFINRISTNAVKELPKEKIAYTVFTNEKGRIIDFTALLNFGESQLLLCNSTNKPRLYSWIDKYTIADDVKESDANSKYVIFELIGPQSESFATLLCGKTVVAMQPNTVKIISTEGVIFFLARVVDLNGSIRFWLIADIESGKKLIRFLLDNKGPFDFNLIGAQAYESYRIEHGIPAAPNELNDNYNPHEAKLLDYVSFTKGCYIGQEVIARLDTYQKVQKYLTGVILSEPAEYTGPVTLTDDEGNEAGQLTSYAYSYKCKKHLGLAYIRKNYIEDGIILNAGKTLKVEIHKLPFKK